MLKLYSYRNKGINAYLDTRGVDEFGNQFRVRESTSGLDYGKPTSEEDKQKAYRSKLHVVEVDTSKLSNGYYIYKEASGHRTVWGWILIQDGEIVDDGEGRKAPVKPTVELPKLTGSERQVSWAESIRERAITRLGDDLGNAAQEETTARYWIDKFKDLK